MIYLEQLLTTKTGYIFFASN